MLSYYAIGQNRQAVLSIASKCAILGSMAFTAFVSRSKPGNQVHNEREFDADHPEPDYFLPAEHRRPNIHIKTELKAKQVYRDYVRTSDYGRKSGRLHHSAKPVREAIIVCKMDTTEEQVRDLIGKLEKGLGIRALYAHVHKDEGHIDEKTGKVKYNPHIHFGYTNLLIERDEQGRRQGELTDMNRPKMRKAQDICAEALGMERAPHYTKRTRKKNLSHQAFRAVKEIENRVQAALDAAEDKPQTAEEKTGNVEQQVINLVAENARIRQALKDSGIAKREDYMELAKIKKSDLDQEEKVLRMGRVLDRVAKANAPKPDPEKPETAPVPVVNISDELLLWQTQERKRREKLEKKLRQEKERTGPSREEIIKERDAEWNKSYKSKFKEAAQEMKGLELPATKMLEGVGTYRERISDRFTTWRANVLNYVAKLKQLLERADDQVHKQALRNKEIIDQDRPYRNLVARLTPEEKAVIDTTLDEMAVEKQQARAQARQQEQENKGQGLTR